MRGSPPSELFGSRGRVGDGRLTDTPPHVTSSSGVARDFTVIFRRHCMVETVLLVMIVDSLLAFMIFIEQLPCCQLSDTATSISGVKCNKENFTLVVPDTRESVDGL